VPAAALNGQASAATAAASAAGVEPSPDSIELAVPPPDHTAAAGAAANRAAAAPAKRRSSSASDAGSGAAASSLQDAAPQAELQLLKGISFHAEPRNLLALMGGSGAGCCVTWLVGWPSALSSTLMFMA
jgi:hypothetical protein